MLRLGTRHTPVDCLEEALQERDAILDELRVVLLRAQQKMKLVADGHRREVEFNIGERVFLKLQPYRQRSLARRPYEKLAARFHGPFPVIKRVGLVAYELKLPPRSRIHPVFHVSQPKKAVGHTPVNPTLPVQLSPELEMVTKPEAILVVRNHSTGQSFKTEVLVKWKQLPSFEDT